VTRSVISCEVDTTGFAKSRYGPSVLDIRIDVFGAAFLERLSAGRVSSRRDLPADLPHGIVAEGSFVESIVGNHLPTACDNAALPSGRIAALKWFAVVHSLPASPPHLATASFWNSLSQSSLPSSLARQIMRRFANPSPNDDPLSPQPLDKVNNWRSFYPPLSKGYRQTAPLLAVAFCCVATGYSSRPTLV
jgi:hypothetical protein